MMAEIGRRIRQRRTGLGLDQGQLAERIGRDRGFVSRVENGKAGEKVEDLLAIARELGTTLADLVGETDEAIVAEVRRRLADGTELAVSFERIARGLPNQPADDQEFIRRAIETFAARYGQKTETDEQT